MSGDPDAFLADITAGMSSVQSITTPGVGGGGLSLSSANRGGAGSSRASVFASHASLAAAGVGPSPRAPPPSARLSSESVMRSLAREREAAREEAACEHGAALAASHGAGRLLSMLVLHVQVACCRG